MNKSRALIGFGFLNWLLALGAGLCALIAPQLLPAADGGLWFSQLLLMVLASAFIFCGRQIAAGRDLGHKAFPAICVAYGLWLLMLMRWLNL